MKAGELLRLVQKGESFTLEFKQRFSDYNKIAKEMIAFANSRGGILLIGVDDDGSIYGVDNLKSDAELIKNTAENYCEPPINYSIDSVFVDGLEVVAVFIEESKNKPHRIQDYKTDLDLNSAQVYIRVNDKSLPASKEMIKILQVRATEKPLKNYKPGKIEKIVFEYLERNELINVKLLSELANISSRRASRCLINLVRADLLAIHTKDNGEEFFTGII